MTKKNLSWLNRSIYFHAKVRTVHAKLTILLKSTFSKNVPKDEFEPFHQIWSWSWKHCITSCFETKKIVSQTSCLSNPHFRIKKNSGFKATSHFSIELIPSLADWLFSRKSFDMSAISIVIVYDWTFSTHHLIHCNKCYNWGVVTPILQSCCKILV